MQTSDQLLSQRITLSLTPWAWLAACGSDVGGWHCQVAVLIQSFLQGGLVEQHTIGRVLEPHGLAVKHVLVHESDAAHLEQQQSVKKTCRPTSVRT